MTEVFVMKLYRLTNRTTGNRWNYGMTENFVMKLYRQYYRTYWNFGMTEVFVMYYHRLTKYGQFYIK